MMKYEDRKKFDTRHGGPFDRGSADSYYHRPAKPHYYVGKSYDSVMLEEVDMSEKEIADYMAGYQWNEDCGDKKDWN